MGATRIASRTLMTLCTTATLAMCGMSGLARAAGAPTIAAPGGTAETTARTTALLHAEINPEESATTYHFEYGQTPLYGAQTASTELQGSEGAATPLEASAVATELKPGAVYHFRVVAASAVGTTVGPDVTFTSASPTPPVVRTGGSDSIAPSAATIAGSVATEGLITTYGFRIADHPGDLGPLTGLGSVGAGFSEAIGQLRLAGLRPNTTYYYTIVGENTDGQSEGEVRSFATGSYPNPNITVTQPRLLEEPLLSWPAGSQANSVKPALKAKLKSKKRKVTHRRKRKTKKKR
jgi:hypothetical protein